MRSGIYCVIMTMVTFCAPVMAYDWTTNPGNGSPENPYQISTPEQLIALGADTNVSQGFNFFALMNDIVFDPDNNSAHVFGKAVIPSFRGSLDGRGFAIEHLRISVSTYNNEPVGLIGTYGDHGACHIENLDIDNAEITVGDGFQKVGILCGLNELNIENCHVSGTIVCGTGSTQIGGLCGSNGDGFGVAGIIAHCDADVSISSSSATGILGECGGLCGCNEGTIAHGSAEGTIQAWSLSTVGGICGQEEYGEIVSCSASVNITAQRYLGYSGGLCGQNHFGSIRFSHATGNMTSVGISTTIQCITSVGGFCGYNRQGKIDSCYSSGDISCGAIEIGGDEESGGFCGRNSGVDDEGIAHCYSTGNVICGAITNPWNKERWIGGFCGTNDASIIHCYSVGTVVTDAADKAGFCYINYKTIEDSFWDTDASGILTAGLSGSISGVAGKATVQMQTAATFTDSGWDFLDESANGENDIWRMCTDGVDYPRLSWEFAENGDFACGDGVDLADLQALADHWLTSTAIEPDTFNTAVDANGDGQIDLADFNILSENWPSSVPIVE